ncbi:MAG: hypothetical protein KF866_07705 [Phycisphaeraceae bacterium]|nr:hypothetical protein [Phycisphaeraceae bacterium]MCW5753764.1 hypothetical protein [Phycisphaeraceae bacterium]
MPVDRCICHDVPFDHLLRLSREVGDNFQTLSSLTGCSTGCGMCKPYILEMLRTGQTRLPVLSPAQVDAILARYAENQPER